MRKKILTLGLFVILLLGLAKITTVRGVELDLSGITCIRFTTSCGHPAVACGSSTEQLLNMVIIMNNYYCP